MIQELEIIDNKCISHVNLDFDYRILDEIKYRLENSEELTLPLEEEISLLYQLAEFELGKFLLQNKGLNGYWTHYIISEDHKEVQEYSLESWILNKAPVVKATQERFKVFHNEMQKLLHSNMKLASVPCGLMEDLASLDYDGFEDINLIGIDIDGESIKLAKENTAKIDKNIKVEFKLSDAWRMDYQNEFDLLTSNGLNIYEAEEAKIISLYQKFYNSLKPEGYLITSFLTPPPLVNSNSPWKNFSKEDLIKQKAIFSDILQAKWQVFHTEDIARAQLESVGFKIIDVIYDSQCMFPTIIAQK